MIDFEQIKWISAYESPISIALDGVAECKRLEKIGRTCYASTDKITNESYDSFLRSIIARGHESVIEHGSMTFEFVTDRATANEMVRHRLASYSQESTRYVAYGKKKPLELILPADWPASISDALTLSDIDLLTVINNAIESENDRKPYEIFASAAYLCARGYFSLLEYGWPAESARHILPQCTATRIVMTANYREWRHFFKMRCAKAAHPNIRLLAKSVLVDAHACIPVIFDDLYEEFIIGGSSNEG